MGCASWDYGLEDGNQGFGIGDSGPGIGDSGEDALMNLLGTQDQAQELESCELQSPRARPPTAGAPQAYTQPIQRGIPRTSGLL